jgi:asparagine synthetase B (glutamine-hydrolysing)
MAASLETRVPMLDNRLVKFAMSLPLTNTGAENETKWPLRQLLYKHVPIVNSSGLVFDVKMRLNRASKPAGVLIFLSNYHHF